MVYLVDNLQYANWSEKIFRQMREGGVDAVHVTVAYHETFRDMVGRLEDWNARFERHNDLILRGTTAADVQRAQETGRTAIFFGVQNPSPIEADIGLIEILHQLGVRFMQLTYNNQSLLAAGCFEAEDSGLTRFGRQAVSEMNRVGLVIDLSHAGVRTMRDAIEASARPVAITHANPDWWHPARRNVPDEVLRALTEKGGMLGFSLYPHHLKDGLNCSRDAFCAMIVEAANRYGAEHLGLGSDLCQDQPDTVVEWMRVGRWSKTIDYGEGSAASPGFPDMPNWFKDNRDFGAIRAGLSDAGLPASMVDGIMGDNWVRFYETAFQGTAA